MIFSKVKINNSFDKILAHSPQKYAENTYFENQFLPVNKKSQKIIPTKLL